MSSVKETPPHYYISRRKMRGPFPSDKTLRLELKRLVDVNNITYFDALMLYITKNDLEIESIAKLINGSLKQIIRKEAKQLNLLK